MHEIRFGAGNAQAGLNGRIGRFQRLTPHFQIGPNIDLQSLEMGMAENVFDGYGSNTSLEQVHGFGVAERVGADALAT